MGDPCLVGIDCGTQSAKVSVFDATGRELASGRTALRPMSRPRPGVAVHPEDDLWTAISSATRQALASFTGDPADVVGVGLCPIRCCKAFLTSDGALREPLISWMDDRAYQPYLPADPAVRWATTASGYLAHRFTGRFCDTAANNVALQWPIDPHTWQWSAEPSRPAAYGLSRDLLVELAQPGDVIGGVTAGAARATGLAAGLPVVATANDKAVEMLGAGPIGDGSALISLGTYVAAMVPGDRYHPSPQGFWTNFACVPGRYLYESRGVRRGMWTLTWFLDLLGPELAAHVATSGSSREEHLEREAATVPAGSDGLVTALDWLAPTDTPFRRGSMLGFDARHGRGHVYRSILEAIALTMKGHVDAMAAELELALDHIVLSGGGSSSDLFAQIFADVLGVPTSRSLGPAGASLGAAMCAAAATGVHPDIDAASVAMAGARESFIPDAGDAATYRELASRYPDLRPATDGWYERAASTIS